MNALLCRAIRERRIVRFYYDGGIRDVEPHCHGCSKTTTICCAAIRSVATAAPATRSAGKCFGWIDCQDLWLPRPPFLGHDLSTTARTTAWPRFTAASDADILGQLERSQADERAVHVRDRRPSRLPLIRPAVSAVLRLLAARAAA